MIIRSNLNIIIKMKRFKLRARARQAKSSKISFFEKCQAKSVFLFKNLRMSVFISSSA